MLVLLAMPLNWRRILLVGAVIAGFALLFPEPVVRGFYALDLPATGLWVTLLIAALGVAALVAFWVLSHRLHWAERERRPGRPSFEDQGPGIPLAMDSGPRRTPGE